MVVYYVVFFKLGIFTEKQFIFCKLVNDDVFMKV